MATLREEEPKACRDNYADNRNDDFGCKRPFRSIQRHDRIHEHQSNVKRAAGEDDFFGEGEVLYGERIRPGVVWVTVKFTVDNKIYNTGENRIANKSNDAGPEVHSDSEKQHKSKCK